MAKILVTGGAGYIGSHTCLELLNAQHEVVVLDNLSNSSEVSLSRVQVLANKSLTFIQGDIRDAQILDQIFAQHQIDAVIHFAGLKAVGESQAKHIVVATHHVPSYELVSPDFIGSPINGAFTAELGNFIVDSPINVWIYGHSHTNIDTTIGHTKIVCNQMGYVFANEHLTNGFDFGKMIEI